MTTEQFTQLIENKIHKMEIDATKVSPALEIMLFVWYKSRADSWLQLNTYLFGVLHSVIGLGIEFAPGDFAEINKECHGGYWFGTSLNGHHFGERLYKTACERNQSAAESYEHSFGRTPFLLGGKRVFEGLEFEYAGLYCHVTGWSQDNTKIKFVGYENRRQEGKKKLFEASRENWPEIRKGITTT